MLWRIPDQGGCQKISQNPGSGAVSANDAPRFDVASVRVNPMKDPRWNFHYTADGLTATDVTLFYLMEEAVGIFEEERWRDVPKWVSEKRFDVVAKYDAGKFGDAAIEQRRLMLQQLLAERFAMKVHHESKMFPIYALVLAKRGRRFEGTEPGEMRMSKNGPMCSITRSSKRLLEMKGCSVGDLAEVMMGQVGADLGREIVDKTGLKGRYSFSLRWTPNDASGSSASDAGPSIFTALEEQLGLQLKPAKSPLDAIVVDHVEMPTGN
jgi:uncharacterized protein (TIGR03435 family)